MRQALEVVAVVAAHLHHALVPALPFQRTGQVLAGRLHPVGERGCGQVFAGAEVMLDLVEDPRMPDARAADHDAVHAVAFAVGLRLLGGIDVAVAEDGDPDARVGLHLPDQGPVGLALVQLGPGAPVDAQGLDADVLQALGHLLDVAAGIVPAQARLHGHRQLHGLHHGLGQAHHLVHVQQQAGAGALAHHLLHRAAVVDVDQLGTGRLGDACGLHHGLLGAAEQLDAHRPLTGEDVQLLPALGRIADQALAADELGVHQVRPVPLAQRSEGRVAHVLHGRQQQGEVPQLDVSDADHVPGGKGTEVDRGA